MRKDKKHGTNTFKNGYKRVFSTNLTVDNNVKETNTVLKKDGVDYTYKSWIGFLRHTIFQKKRQSFFFTFAFMILLFSIGPGKNFIRPNSSVVNANQQTSEIHYKVVQIQYGESLWSIAENNRNPNFDDIHSYIKEIKRCNQLTSDEITAGNYLMIPYIYE